MKPHNVAGIDRFCLAWSHISADFELESWSVLDGPKQTQVSPLKGAPDHHWH